MTGRVFAFCLPDAANVHACSIRDTHSGGIRMVGLVLDDGWMRDPTACSSGLQHGWLHSRSGDTWSGNVDEGLPHGEGRYVFADSRLEVKGKIHGDSLDALAFSGQGFMKWPDGSSFEGTLTGSQFEGRGTFCWANGDRYDGEWIQSKRHGIGTMWSADPSRLDLPAAAGSRAHLMRYEGEWADNVMHGKGVIEFFGFVPGTSTLNLADHENLLMYAKRQPVIRRFAGTFIKGFPTCGSLQTREESFARVCFDGTTLAGDYPIWYWAGNASGNLRGSTLVQLAESGEEYRMAEAQVRKSMSASDLTIQSIHRVQNDELRICYDMQRRSLEKKVLARSGRSWNTRTMERWAFHAPGERKEAGQAEPWECIIEEGFQAMLAGSQNGRVYGAGIYFAKHAALANQYAQRAAAKMAGGSLHIAVGAREQAQTCRMFLTRIVTGMYTVGTPSMIQPPLDPNGAKGEHFHSMVDNVMEPRIFVVNDNTRAYPGYLVTYKPQARHSSHTARAIHTGRFHTGRIMQTARKGPGGMVPREREAAGQGQPIMMPTAMRPGKRDRGTSDGDDDGTLQTARKFRAGKSSRRAGYGHQNGHEEAGPHQSNTSKPVDDAGGREAMSGDAVDGDDNPMPSTDWRLGAGKAVRAAAKAGNSSSSVQDDVINLVSDSDDDTGMDT